MQENIPTMIQLCQGKQYKFNVEIPLVEVLDQQVMLSQNDVELTYALRPFETYSEEVKAAIWLLFSSPSASLLRDVGAFMRSKVIKKILDSNTTVMADFDLLQSDDFLTIDQESEGAIAQVALYLNEIKDDRFDPQELIVTARNRDAEKATIQGMRKITLTNSTWMTMSLVESVIYSLVHSKMRYEHGIPETVVKQFMRAKVDVPVHVMDFLVEKLQCSFDRSKVVDVTIATEDPICQRAISDLNLQTRELKERVAKDGLPLLGNDYRQLENLCDEATSHSRFFLNVLFGYLYPELAQQMFDAYMSSEADMVYINHGGYHLEAWVSNEIYNKSKLEHYDYKVFAREEDLALTESQMTEIVCKQTSEDFSAIRPRVIVRKSGMERDTRLEDGTLVAGYLSKICDKSILDVNVIDQELEVVCPRSKFSGGQRQTYLNGLIRNRDIAATSEILRVVRAHGSADADARTNEMANLFPDQYEYFYRDRLVEGLIHETCKKVQIRSNAPWLTEAMKFRYSNDESLVFAEYNASLPRSVFDSNASGYLAEHAPIFFVDCNKGVFNPMNDDCGAKFSTTWTSPFMADAHHELTAGLTAIQQQMRTPMGFTGIVVVPLIIDPRNYIMFMSILNHMGHNIEFVLPSKIHETFIYLKIWAVDVSVIKKTATLERMIFSRTRKVAGFLAWHAVYLKLGVIVRHGLWQLRYDACIVGWKTERYKHLSKMGIGFSLSSDRKLVVRRILTRISDRFVGEKMSKFKKRALKKAQLASTLLLARTLNKKHDVLQSVQAYVPDKKVIDQFAHHTGLNWNQSYDLLVACDGNVEKAMEEWPRVLQREREKV